MPLRRCSTQVRRIGDVVKKCPVNGIIYSSATLWILLVQDQVPQAQQTRLGRQENMLVSCKAQQTPQNIRLFAIERKES